jgi:hypothetical protein
MADERIIRLFLDLTPPQFVDVSIPHEANFIFLINLWRSQGFLITEKDFIEWRHIIGIRELPLTAPVESLQAEKAKLN